MTASENSRLPDLSVEGVLSALGLSAGGEERGLAYTVIRGNNGPRWLLPAGSRLADSILREWRPYGRLTHLYWRAVRLASRWGVPRLAPGTTSARLPRDAAKQVLRRAGFEGEAEAPVILVGNTGSTRKLLVFLAIAGRGNVVIKIPLGPLAGASLANEAEVLKRLNGGCGAPRILDYQLDTGAAITEYLPGRLGSRRLKPDYLRMLIDLARRGEAVTLRERAAGLRERLGGHGAFDDKGEAVERALALLEDDTSLPAALVHGDFAPWNIRDRGDGCSLIDWESAEWTGLPLHDLCHFFCMQAKLFAPRTLFAQTLEREGSWRRYLAALELPPALLRPLEAAFLLDSLARTREWGPEESVTFYLEQMRRFLEPSA